MLGRIRCDSQGQSPSPKWSVALHRQPFEADRKQTDQQIGQHEHRHRKCEHRETHHEPVSPGAGLRGGYYSDRHRDQHRDDERQQSQRHSRLHALSDQRGHRQIGENRRAEVAVQQPPDPAAELHQERLVQTELRADALDVVGGRNVTGDNRGRIARRQEQQREHEQRDHRHDDQRRAEPAQNIDDHETLRAAGTLTSSRRSRGKSRARRSPRTGSTGRPRAG